MSKIATEQEAFDIGKISIPISNKCCTKARAEALGCSTNGNFASNQLVTTESLSSLGYSPATAPNGVYIVHTNGLVYKRDVWKTSENSKAVGVGVKTSKCSFVIAPDEQTSIQWGGFGTLISGCTIATEYDTAQIDYKGNTNTDAIVSQLGTTSEYAAKYCRNYAFKNGKVGYQPALGELYEAYQNKSEVDACMSLIGGKALYDSSINNYYIWSSTQFEDVNSWTMFWKSGTISIYPKNVSKYYYTARPFSVF